MTPLERLERCEICGKPITPSKPGVEYYVKKRSNEDKVMYRHEGCPK